MLQSFSLLALSLALPAYSKIVRYDWNITWVSAAPDGFVRPVIGINGEFPPPVLRATLGDTVIVNVDNQLGNQSTSLHWHGLSQNGTSYMDGSVGVAQCPVPPGSKIQYKWFADNAGTYWYHSHNAGQYADGLWGPLIIEDPNPPFHYDDEIILTLSDWYHEGATELITTYQSHAGEAADGLPAPSAGALINWSKAAKIYVKPGLTYLVRIICSGSYPGHAWVIDSHDMTAVETDANYNVPTNVNAGGLLTRVAPGQRQGMLITTKNDTSQNYAIWDTMDVNMLFLNKGMLPPMGYNTNVTAYLVYNDSAPLPDPPVFHEIGNSNFWDDTNYVPLDEAPLLGPVDYQFVLNMNSANISGISRFINNNVTYLTQKVPSLYSALTTGDDNSNPAVYGQVVPIIIEKDAIVEIVINNLNSNLHPWHMHGHRFQVLDRPDPGWGTFNGTFREGYPHAAPVWRDTVMVQDLSWVVIRFKADNPGVWPLHCHIELHLDAGLMGTIIEAPDELAMGNQHIPRDHIEACKAFPMEYQGNAAGNSGVNALDLTGAVTEVPQINTGAQYPPAAQVAAGKR